MKKNTTNEAEDNFKKLEDKFKLIIGECSEKNLKRVDIGNDFTNKFSGMVECAKVGEQYILDNSLSVYLFYNACGELIDCWISSKPVIKDNGEYTGDSFFEYTCGGYGNSLIYNSKYYCGRQIGLVENSRIKCRPMKTINIVSIENNPVCHVFSETRVFYCNNNSFEYLEKCDLEGFINSFKNNDIDIKLLQDCLNKINLFYKKNKLKGMLVKYRSLRNNNIFNRKVRHYQFR